MRYVAAYLLAVLGGNSSPTDKDLMKILGSVGIDADGASMTRVVGELKGKSIEEVIAVGRTKMASVPSGGAVAAGSSAAVPEAGKEDAKEEKKEESEEEGSDDDMGFGLFD